jgi:hypothetical protein
MFRRGSNVLIVYLPLRSSEGKVNALEERRRMIEAELTKPQEALASTAARTRPTSPTFTRLLQEQAALCCRD